MNKVGNRILNFFKGLFSASGDVGSKRVVGFGTFLLFSGQCIANMCFGTQIQSELIWATVGIIATCFGLNALVAMKGISAKSQVASDIVKESPTNENTEASQEILNSDKP